ncbi:MAG: tRNA (adenosine(37)-N6)-threonylcarbamoyltransferase complex transferase subunit TsaD [Flavobacteriales bacterium]|nr:tRNA (adenosine(37)-N6)-threonylcarbamoyltransferase complex transferase subunit TsaD [Flavobacteriales bacterium]|tara:strand:+ start:3288 stop:4313 length:1026 start_codon:yes stop_codon:yes gene_type:complete
MDKPVIILGIESSCDDTSAAIIKDGKKLSNIIGSQKIHEKYGGVVPELASRAHLQNIIPVVNQAIKESRVKKNQISAVAFTRGPGLLGSLLVGVSFAKSFGLALDIPIIDVNHMHGHILAHFIKENDQKHNPPKFPFLCLTVSGGHTQIIKVNDYLDFDLLGETIDDAAGEAFDKSAKTLGMKYPGGPLIDKYAINGNPHAFKFGIPKVDGLNFSFSGLKTSILYFIQKKLKDNPKFIKQNLDDICASIQFSIVKILIDKLEKASEQTQIKEIAIAGGVSANSGLRNRIKQMEKTHNWNTHIPPFSYCTDNAAMIAITGYYKYLNNEFCSQKITANPRLYI